MCLVLEVYLWSNYCISLCRKGLPIVYRFKYYFKIGKAYLYLENPKL